MKKLMIMMVVLGSVAFGRDFEHRERMEMKEVMNNSMVNQEMAAREVSISEQNMNEYSDFHWQLKNMDRGHEAR